MTTPFFISAMNPTPFPQMAVVWFRRKGPHAGRTGNGACQPQADDAVPHDDRQNLTDLV
jgi:hypothetical protein